MNVTGLFISCALFLMCLYYANEIWFHPEKYIKKLRRNQKKSRFLFWGKGRIDISSA